MGNEERVFEKRRSGARLVALVFLIGLGFRFLQAHEEKETPVVVAAAPMPVSAGAAAVATVAAPVRLEWFSFCDPAQTQVGIYFASDGACTPSQTQPFAWLQSQLLGVGALAPGEYLERAAHPALPACGARVLASNGQLAGWVCLDGQGVYRLDADAQKLMGRWQFRADQTWAQVK